MRLFFCVGMMVALAGSCFGMAMGLSEYAARNESDVVAHVLITATAPIKPSPKNASATLSDELGRFKQIATARVLTPVKGCQAGDIISLTFDNGFGCPNVFYRETEECLVFLKKDPAGLHATMNLYTGRFSVKDGQVENFYLLGPREKMPATTPLQTVIDWLLAAPAKDSANIEPRD